MKGLEAKGPFSCLGLQVRFIRAYQTPINCSFLYFNSSSICVKIIFEAYVVLMTKLLAKKLENGFEVKRPFGT